MIENEIDSVDGKVEIRRGNEDEVDQWQRLRGNLPVVIVTSNFRSRRAGHGSVVNRFKRHIILREINYIDCKVEAIKRRIIKNCERKHIMFFFTLPSCIIELLDASLLANFNCDLE